MPWKYQREMASMLRFVTARIGAPFRAKSQSAYRPSKLDANTTNVTPAAAAHGLTRNARVMAYRKATNIASIEIERISSSSSSVAHAAANRYCAAERTCGIQ